MIGLIIIPTLLIWLILSAMLSSKIPDWLGIKRHSTAWALIIFPLILTTPIADEIIGQAQFHYLCEKNAVVWLSPDWELVKRARWISKIHSEVDGYFIPITQRDGGYVNTDTGELFFRSRSFLTQGGLLRRTLGDLWGNATTCYAKDFDQIESKLKLKEILK